MKKNRKKRVKQTPLKHKIALFIVYFVLFLAIFGLIDYYAYDILNPIIFILLSLISSIVVTFLHLKNRQKSKADEIAKDIEEII